MSYEQKSCDSFGLCDFYVPFLPNEKSINFFRVIHIQSARHASSLMGSGEREGGMATRLSQLYHRIFRPTGEYFRVDVIALHDSGDAFFLTPLPLDPA